MQWDTLYSLFETWSWVSAMLIAGYVFFAVMPFVVIYILLKRTTVFAKIIQRYPNKKDIWREVLYSLLFVAIAACVFMFTGWLYSHHYTLIYKNIDVYGWPYYIATFFIALIAHDAYYYWTHRMLHWRPLFKHVHKTHHISVNPTPLSAFSFHPVESLIQVLFVPIIVCVLPLRDYVVDFFWCYSLGTNTVGHFGHEFFPRWFARHKIFKWHNTTTHHNLHHTNVKTNFGLYLNFWDRMMKTNTPNYEEYFEKVVDRRDEARALKKAGKAAPQPENAVKLEAKIIEV